MSRGSVSAIATSPRTCGERTGYARVAADQVAQELQARIGVTATILPMTDVAVRTEILTDDGWLEFQEYFVHRHQAPEVREVRFRRRRARCANGRGGRCGRSGRAGRHRPIESDRVDRTDPRRPRHDRAPDRGAETRVRRSWRSAGSSAAARSRARPTGCSSPWATHRARPAWRAPPRGTPRRVRPRHGRRGPRARDRGDRARDLHDRTIMSDDAARARVARETVAFAESLRRPAAVPSGS